jgi:hypothetical protein
VRIIAACALAFFATSAPVFAECVVVKYRSTPEYRDTPVCLDTFDCTKTQQGGDVREICFDAKKSYMLIKLNETWYHYCSVDPASDDNLLKAQPIYEYYKDHFRSHGSVHGPFDCRDHPVPHYPECSCKAG